MKNKKKLSVSAALAGAALGGLIGTSAVAHKFEESSSGRNEISSRSLSRVSTNGIDFAGRNATGGVYDQEGKHDCQGKNDCKGQGGCATGDNGCKGKNSCKGKGGCSTSGH